MGNARFRHSSYYQQLLSRLGETFHKGGYDTALSVKSEFTLNFDQFMHGQRYSAVAKPEQIDVLEVCLRYANSIFILATYLSKHQQIEWIENAIASAKHLKRNDFVCIHSMQLASTHDLMGDKKRAQEIYWEALDYAKQNHLSSFIPDIWCRLGEIAYAQAQYTDAQQHYQNALPFLTEAEHRRDRITCLIALGEIEVQQKNFKVAARYFDDAYDLSLEVEDELIDADLYYTLGKFYIALNAPEKAKTHLEEALAIFEQKQHWREKRHVLVLLGDTHQKLHNYAKAEKLYLEAIALSRHIADRFGLISHLLMFANFYINLSRFKEAEQILHEVNQLIKDFNHPERAADVALSWAKLYIAQSDRQSAIPYLRTAEQIYQDQSIEHKLQFVRKLMQ